MPVFAQTVQTNCRRPIPEKNIPKYSPEQQLQPWLSNCRRRIQRKLETQHLEPFSCTFNLNENNKVYALKITKNSGSSSFDDAVVDAINTTDLQPPMHANLNLIHSRGLKVDIFEDMPPVHLTLGPDKQ